MSAINWRRVLVGAAAAGIVMNLMDAFTNGVLLLSANEANSVRLGLDPRAVFSVANVSIVIAIDFLFGGVLVWLYAAIEPRYGAGPATAVRAAMAMYLATMGIVIGFAVLGVVTRRLLVEMAVAGLVTFVVGALTGAWVYRRQGQT